MSFRRNIQGLSHTLGYKASPFLLPCMYIFGIQSFSSSAMFGFLVGLLSLRGPRGLRWICLCFTGQIQEE